MSHPTVVVMRRLEEALLAGDGKICETWYPPHHQDGVAAWFS